MSSCDILIEVGKTIKYPKTRNNLQMLYNQND